MRGKMIYLSFLLFSLVDYGHGYFQFVEPTATTLTKADAASLESSSTQCTSSQEKDPTNTRQFGYRLSVRHGGGVLSNSFTQDFDDPYLFTEPSQEEWVTVGISEMPAAATTDNNFPTTESSFLSSTESSHTLTTSSFVSSSIPSSLSISSASTVQSSISISSNPPKGQAKKDIWIGMRIGLGVLIPLLVLLVVVIISIIVRKIRRSRMMSVSSGRQRCLPRDSDPRYSQGVEFGSVNWGKARMPMQEMSSIKVRGKVHRVPTVLRPGPARPSWRYDPKSFELDSSPRNSNVSDSMS